MSLDANLVKSIHAALARVDERITDQKGPRLIDDAHRLWMRLQQFIDLRLVPVILDTNPLELATYALQLPARRSKMLASGKSGKSTLRERAEEAAELLVGAVDDVEVNEELLDRATRLLHEMPHRSPMLDEARLLADAINLDDFGLTGLVGQAVQLTRQGEGLMQLLDGLRKREAYNYWEARLREGFHFDAVRQMARRRLENLRIAQQLLDVEAAEDGVLADAAASKVRG